MIKYLRLIRVHQWIKNIFVFVPILFSLHLFENDYLLTTLFAFFIFCLASSTIYVINDIVDIEADRSHPVKKNRPLPSGAISVNTALAVVVILLILVSISMLYFNIEFILITAGFILLNVFYSFWFKNVVILDVFSIAAGFAMRVLAGAFVIQVPISSWLLLTTMFISLFLGVMKRHSELTVVSGNNNSSSRKVLAQYSLNFADQMATVAAAGVIICYALYTVAPRTITVFETENLIYTTPFVVFGIFRYMYLEYMSNKGENTTKIIATDVPMIVTVILYIAATVLIIYKVI
ncbi:MAG: decaprenyl-phosphate phosphoribosyltransferase [Ignavibacteriaceae bacterium]|nr:decaprenyl-phosphate phosphoribosyltransferase [Ignavibacteria bacterium]MBT8391645.1 decaprenyl-phosphate phosphoribosyltransferase [Ignavibacteria bacterium]NNJ53848.1 decaprenyl-phosphate phosphoribosyltransferase [Ignavibacteriaceae bacterium]NNL22420.1 decaprenyl-phosphate phosphoribosyltransferase [Ignavibacteriaceae bacterium]